MKHLFIVASILICASGANAQSMYFTRNGKVSFFSKTSMENIDAVNNEVFSIIDAQKGEIAFAILVKSFKFEKALMEEHFNENYMESGKFPKATFNGKITNFSSVSLSKDGIYPVQVEGDLTIHGVTKKITSEGKISVANGVVSSLADFAIKLSDYQIAVPSLVSEKIAESIDIKVACSYTPKESK